MVGSPNARRAGWTSSDQVLGGGSPFGSCAGAHPRFETSYRGDRVPEFSGRTAIVTGGALGIGRGIARVLAREGASVVIADIDEAAAGELAAEITKLGGQALAMRTDVSSAADAEAAAKATIARFGRLDILVNNAGIQPIDGYFAVDEMPEALWDRIVSVNLKGVFLMSKSAIPAMRESGGGVIVNIASVQGLQSAPKVPAYAASKAGVLSLTRNMALDYAAERIRVVAICPGTIESEMVLTSARSLGGDIQERLVEFGKVHPIGRLGMPEDIGNAVAYLASDRASFITGEYLCVDGGLMAKGAWAP
jgi:NAD(P)-dependent dehydrogenase (short-subunit alcohol dehydrogenase family)